MILKHTHYPILFTLLVVAPVAYAQDSIEIKQSLPVGKKITQSIQMTQTGTMESGGEQVMDATVSIESTHSLSITANENNQKKGTLVYESAAIKMDMGEFTMDFDSESDQPGPLKGMIGKEVDVTFSADDTVDKVTGVDALIVNAEPGDEEILKQWFTESQITIHLNQNILQSVPENAVDVGDTWPFETTIPLQQGIGAMKVSGEYEFKEIVDFEGNECLLIAVDGDISGELKMPDGVDGEDMEMTFEDSTYTGTVHFDNNLGLLRNTNLTLKSKANISAEEIQMSSNTEQTISTKITKVEDL